MFRFSGSVSLNYILILQDNVYSTYRIKLTKGKLFYIINFVIIPFDSLVGCILIFYNHSRHLLCQITSKCLNDTI